MKAEHFLFGGSQYMTLNARDDDVHINHQHQEQYHEE